MSGTPAYSAKQFYLDDYPRTLFPLNTNKFLIQNGEDRVRQRIDQILSGQGNFLPQVRAYAAKDALHLRRTFKLDPVCEFYLYDLIYRNRNIFRRSHNKNKSHYGYRFEDGLPIPASRSYRDFKSDVFSNSLFMDHFLGFDVASYFNSLYHHDLIEWFSARGASQPDTEGFDKFLREIASGRSLDCLPHGLYPTKMIGNDFLRFIEEAHFLKSSLVCRFMDDVYLFSDNKSDVTSDFLAIQRILGQKSMSVNPGKTGTVTPRTNEANDGIDDLKKKLLARRRRIVTTSLYDDEGDDEDAEMFIDVALNLSQAELKYVHGLLSHKAHVRFHISTERALGRFSAAQRSTNSGSIGPSDTAAARFLLSTTKRSDKTAAPSPVSNAVRPIFIASARLKASASVSPSIGMGPCSIELSWNFSVSRTAALNSVRLPSSTHLSLLRRYPSSTKAA